MESSNIKILAIDDNQDNLTILKALIKDAFPEAITLTALNGTTGIELAAKEDPDVILLDIVMPGMDGFAVCEKLKSTKILSDIPLIFVTAIKGDKESRIRALECGAEAFIAKPIDESELTAQICAMVKIKTANTNKRTENVRLAALVSERTKELEETHNATLKLLDKLRVSELRFKQVSEEALEWIWEVDKEGLYTYSSPVVESLLGYKPEEIIGKKHFYDFFAPDNKLYLKEVALKNFSKKESFKNLDNTNLHKDGHVVILESNGSPILDNEGNFIGYRGVDSDATARKQAEQELIKAKEKAEENSRLKTAFLANISHEIRTPLNSILGFAEMLKEPDLSSNELKEYTNIIDKSGKRMLSLINDLIDISKIEAGLIEVYPSKYNLNEQIDDIFDFFKLEAEQKKIVILLNKGLSDIESSIYSDKEKVNAVLINLVKNALKFTTEGYVEIRYKKKDNFLEFCVLDSGIGIKPEQHEFIFERFRQASESITRNYEGSGLGLSISKAYVKMLDGKIWVESELEKGSKFYFTIPYN